MLRKTKFLEGSEEFACGRPFNLMLCRIARSIFKVKTNKVTQKKQDAVEIETIKKMAPIVQKREKMLSFKPTLAKNKNYSLLN